LAVPVFFGILETLANCHAAEVVTDKRLEHVLCEVVHALVHGVVLDVKPLVARRGLSFYRGIPDLLRGINGVWAVVQITLSVQVEVRDVVSQLAQPCVRGIVAG
jgi:hypothetical protein